MKKAKYLKKAFWFSLVVHAAVLCLLIVFMRNSPTAMKKTINMDLSMKKIAETPPPEEEEEPEEPPEPVKPQELPKNMLAAKNPGPKTAAAPPQGPQTQAEGAVAVDAPENSGKSPFLGGGGSWGDAGGEGGILADYEKGQFDYIRKIVLQHLRYPEEAQNRGLEGRVLISFVVMSDGTVKDIKVVDSSGYTILDKNAIETVKNSAPFPKPPGNAELRMPINYVLEV